MPRHAVRDVSFDPSPARLPLLFNKNGFYRAYARAMTSVAFYVQRSVGGELRPVYERNGVRWTEGGQREPHFCFESLFQPSIYVKEIDTYRLLGLEGICADSSCTCLYAPDAQDLLVVGGDRAKPDRPTIDSLRPVVDRILNMQKKMEAPRSHVVCVDLVAPDGHETYYEGIGPRRPCRDNFARARPSCHPQVTSRPT